MDFLVLLGLGLLFLPFYAVIAIGAWWGLASGFDLRATAIGLLVGLLYTAAQATAA